MAIFPGKSGLDRLPTNLWVFGAKFYGSDALPDGNQQKYTLGSTFSAPLQLLKGKDTTAFLASSPLPMTP